MTLYLGNVKVVHSKKRILIQHAIFCNFKLVYIVSFRTSFYQKIRFLFIKEEFLFTGIAQVDKSASNQLPAAR